jgi:hypothetical protein
MNYFFETVPIVVNAAGKQIAIDHELNNEGSKLISVFIYIKQLNVDTGFISLSMNGKQLTDKNFDSGLVSLTGSKSMLDCELVIDEPVTGSKILRIVYKDDTVNYQERTVNLYLKYLRK